MRYGIQDSAGEVTWIAGPPDTDPNVWSEPRGVNGASPRNQPMRAGACADFAKFEDIGNASWMRTFYVDHFFDTEAAAAAFVEELDDLHDWEGSVVRDVAINYALPLADRTYQRYLGYDAVVQLTGHNWSGRGVRLMYEAHWGKTVKTGIYDAGGELQSPLKTEEGITMKTEEGITETTE
jgi:hypothetical protein